MTGLVALTGATGFIGSALLPRLTQGEGRVRALTRQAKPGRDASGVEWVEGSLSDENSLRELVKDADSVIHCAGAIKAGSRAEFQEINAAGTANLAAVAAQAAKPPRFLLLSSLAAREPQLSDYAFSKRQAEAELARQDSALQWAALRPPVVYGPGDRATLALFRQFAKGQTFMPRARDNRVSLLYVDDLVEAVLYLLGRKDWQGEVLELDDGRPEGYAWSDLAEIAGEHLGKSVSTIAVPQSLLWLPAAANEALAPLMGRTPMLTRGKLRELFHQDWVCQRRQGTSLNGWQGQITFDQGFPRTLAWYKDKGWL